jgi:hypothetical protein
VEEVSDPIHKMESKKALYLLIAAHHLGEHHSGRDVHKCVDHLAQLVQQTLCQARGKHSVRQTDGGPLLAAQNEVVEQANKSIVRVGEDRVRNRGWKTLLLE